MFGQPEGQDQHPDRGGGNSESQRHFGDINRNIEVIAVFGSAVFAGTDTAGHALLFASVRAGIRFSPEVDSYLSYGFAIGGGVDFGRYSVKLGYEYNAAKASIYSQGRHEEIYSKPSLLFCSFAFNF